MDNQDDVGRELTRLRGELEEARRASTRGRWTSIVISVVAAGLAIVSIVQSKPKPMTELRLVGAGGHSETVLTGDSLEMFVDGKRRTRIDSSAVQVESEFGTTMQGPTSFAVMDANKKPRILAGVIAAHAAVTVYPSAQGKDAVVSMMCEESTCSRVPQNP